MWKHIHNWDRVHFDKVFVDIVGSEHARAKSLLSSLHSPDLHEALVAAGV
jgi:hypothetical protein